MSLKAVARYVFGLPFVRMMALNDDLTRPEPDRIIGGAGPFDFSGAPAPANVPLTVKFDAEPAVTLVVNLTVGVADISAVTVAELAARIDAAAAVAGLDIDASVEALTGRLKIEYSGTEAYAYMQVYGLCATLSLVGQGFGCQFVRADTLKSIADTPDLKADEKITTTDALGIDTEISTDGYRKGVTLTVVDTAQDPRMRALMEGGAYNETTGVYEVPTSTSGKTYFYIEAFVRRYRQGTNKEGDHVDYLKKLYRSCKGAVGQVTHQRGWADGNYTVVGTAGIDDSGNALPDTQETVLTRAAYAALDLENV
jgi:hypothetical protein